ncbi:MAG: hypothetical protein Q4D38_02230 [Planctomycetia bacterium]|nr:hypothetical protein [Planctomycetia bacterium]
MKHVDVVKYFVEKGADVALKDENGKTPLDYAQECVNAAPQTGANPSPHETARKIKALLKDAQLKREKHVKMKSFQEIVPSRLTTRFPHGTLKGAVEPQECGGFGSCLQGE